MWATISDMGPDLLARLLELNDTQAGVLSIAFRIADERGLLLIDMKDLRSMLTYVADHAKEYKVRYGTITSASVGAIQRALLTLEDQGGNVFFGEPSFDIKDLLSVRDGKGIMSVLAADRLMLQPKLYSTFLLWLLSELYSTLPEVGDQALPKLVFFFDEAHMLFEDTSRAMTDKIEQVVRLVRSKGVGIYFVTQSPSDIPVGILGQLGNRVQHALRAYTPKDQEAVRTAAKTFRANPAFSTEEAITTLETGEALVSFLDEKGAPSIVERARILFPLSQIGAITDEQRAVLMRQSELSGKYDMPIDRESAFEVLLKESEQAVPPPPPANSGAPVPPPAPPATPQAAPPATPEKPAKEEKKKPGLLSKVLKAIITALTATLGTIIGTSISNKVTGKKTKSNTSTTGRVVKNTTSAATRTITRELTRDILGNLIK